MRVVVKAQLIALAVILAVGPLSAAPMSLTAGTSISAPSPSSAHPVRAVLEYLAGGAAAFGLTIKKDIGSIATKYVQRAQAAAPDYKTGVSNAGSTWESNTAAAEPAYDAGVQTAINNKKFGKGVAGKAGKYQTNAVNLGSARYGTGVANAQSAYQTGMAPVLSALQAITLPSRSFRGSPANQARANAVSTALAALRSNK